MTYRDPNQEDLDCPLFKVIQSAIKTWDINVPDQYGGYCRATGNHVMAIKDAVEDLLNKRKQKND